MENKEGDDELFDRLTVRRYILFIRNIYLFLIDIRS